MNQSDERKGLVARLRRETWRSGGPTSPQTIGLLVEAADLLERDSIQLRECGEEVVQASIATKQSTDATGHSATEWDFKLPCDVHLPPNTYFRKGVHVGVMLKGLRIRTNWDDNDTRFISTTIPPSEGAK
jgi:hypothetical protein